MKLSCLPVSFFEEILHGQMSVYEWACIGKQVGLDAIDLSILFIPSGTMAEAWEIRRQVERAGMQVAMLTSYPDFTHPLEEQRRRELDLAVQSVRIASALGASLLRVTAGQAHPATSLEEGIEWAVSGLNQLAEITQGLGVQLVYENHAKPGAWEYTDFSQPPELFSQILGRLSPVIKVNFDTGNATAFSPDPLALLEHVLPRLGSIHASDTGTIGSLQHVLVGSGYVNFPAIFRRLQHAEWNGWICIEEASYLGVDGIRRATQFIRNTWEQLLNGGINEQK